MIGEHTYYHRWKLVKRLDQFSLKKQKNWQSGSLVEQLSDGSYQVKTENATIRQYGYYLKPKEKPATNVVPEVSPDVAKELPVTAALNGK